MNTHRVITQSPNFSFTTSSIALVVWHVTPPYWNYSLDISGHRVDLLRFIPRIIDDNAVSFLISKEIGSGDMAMP